MTKPRILKLTPIALAMLTALPVFAQTDTEQSATEQEAGEIEEVIVTGSQIKGAAINEALSVSVVTVEDIEAFGVESGDELLDIMTEQGQNFFNEAENISGGVNSARGDVGAFNLRNIGTGNTLALLNGRRMVNSATYQTEEVGGSFIPVNTVNSAAIPVFGLKRVEVLRDGASAIYGADAVAGVVNTVMKDDYDGFSVRGRFTTYDNIPRDDYSVTIEWGDLFNDGRSAVGVFANYYSRDRVNSQDDPKWNAGDLRDLVPPEFADSFGTWSANSSWGQYELYPRVGSDYGLRDLGIIDRQSEFETYPIGDPRCEGGYIINAVTCGHADGQGTYRYNLNTNRDLASELERFNLYAYFNHEFANGIEAYTEFSWYESKTNLIRHPSAAVNSASELLMSKSSYYNPLGPCGSPNRLPDSVIGTEVPCEGLDMFLDNYRWTEAPRIVDNDGKIYRILQGFRGTFGADWDWDSAIVYSKAERNEVTRNRISNTLMTEALADPTAAGYNPFAGGMDTNIERALVDVHRDGKTDLKMIDFKLSRGDLFDIWGGPIGFLAGFEYREESFVDDRDPRLDGTIQFTTFQGETFPYVSDVMNSSPTPDSRGSRDVTSLFTEFAVPLLPTLDLQLALRYENFSDVGSTTVPKIAFGWRPTEWFMLRGSWSEAFRAPNLVTVNEGLVVRANTREDAVCDYAYRNSPHPDAGDLDCSYGIQRRAFGNEDLKPEKSDNSSIGVVLNPIPNVTMTIDFWKIEKKDTIGLFGEVNHTILDLLQRLDAGTGSCSSVTGNPLVLRGDINGDEDDIYLAAGLCPVGDVTAVNDTYVNLDTRVTEGFDFGVYWDLPTLVGDWTFTWRGSVYTRYDQEPGPAAQSILDAYDAGIIDTVPEGYGDILRMDGNQEEKMNASVRWRRNDWSATLAWYYLSDFYSTYAISETTGAFWQVPSHDYYNFSADYRFDLMGSNTRLTFGIRNVTNERAPLVDRYFGFASDAHNDYGRSYYIDLRMAW